MDNNYISVSRTKETYPLLWCMQVYKHFTKRYSRATEMVLKIYRIKPKYLINALEHKKHVNWFRFKRIVKLVDERLEFLKSKHMQDRRSIDMYRRDFKLLYPDKPKTR